MILTKRKKLILLGLLVGLLHALPAHAELNPLEITESDASPSTFPYKINFTNGTLTDNGDGTVNISNGGSVPDATNAVSGWVLTINTDGSSRWEPDDTGAGASSNSFETISVPAGTAPVADSATDTLTITETSFLTITGTAATDTIAITQVTTDLGTDGLIAADAVALGTDTTNAYVADLTAGTAIDVSGGGAETANVTVNFDSTEVASTTWGAGEASQVWTFNNSGTDTTLTMSSALGTFSHGVTVSGLLRSDANLAIRNGASPSVLTMYEASGDGTNSVSFQPPALDNDTDYIWPTSENLVSGYVLTYTNNGTGELTWEPDNTSTAAPGTKPPKEYWWTASALEPLEAADSIPPLSKFTGTNLDILTVSYDDGTDEGRKVSFKVPSDVDTSGTVTFRVHSFSRTATTGNFILDARSTATGAEGESWDGSLTTDAAAADAVQGTTNLMTVTTWTETVSNLGWAANDLITVMLYRDANNASDTLVGDLEVAGFGIEVPRA